ncbi:probable glutathione peroxidase 4 [Carica papaya]|uniref:probable glutathione peroxidase 4 n=1 Tax=Carica papaya TaxID=3649 RepID=UPI000B8CE1A5|nr:probable glutathione peroxidase 4 [Carica papaya]
MTSTVGIDLDIPSTNLSWLDDRTSLSFDYLQVKFQDKDFSVRVNGPLTAPIYKFLKASKFGFLGSRIKWNFTKFLVDKDGIVLQRYSTTTYPRAIEDDIKKALGEM